MFSKSFQEMREVDVTPYCDVRKGKDENGKSVDLLYLNWAKCKDLLHEHGAETVYFTPLRDENGSYVFTSKEVANKDGRVCGCYFVSVEIHIDDRTFTMDMPLMNGSLVVYDDTMNQLRISNSHARAFVKGVAIHTGLGFGLWVKDETTEADDLSGHNIYSIKRRIQELVTSKMQSRSLPEILAAMDLKEKAFEGIMKSFDNIAVLERKLSQL